MANANQTAEALDRLFREVVLTLGGIFHVYDCDDWLITSITASLDRVYRRNRERMLKRGAPEPPLTRPEPHPAVEELLSRIGQ